MLYVVRFPRLTALVLWTVELIWSIPDTLDGRCQLVSAQTPCYNCVCICRQERLQKLLRSEFDGELPVVSSDLLFKFFCFDDASCLLRVKL